MDSMDTADRLGRPLRNLRLSVTDRCNLRCAYCMPEEDYVWLPRAEILSFEEIGALVDAFVELGVDRLRLTGGEPLLRRDLPLLVRMLASKPAIRDLSLTTNGVLLEREAAALAGAGLHRVSVSLDTLRESTFRELARRDGLERVLAGIEVASAAGFRSLKLDTVVIRGANEDEIADLLEFARRRRAEVRFIEYMDVGGATRWSMDRVVTRAEILATIARRYGAVRALPEQGSAPAARFALPDGLVFGVIASTTAPFCRSCDRARLTADGLWLTCLYARSGLDLRALLRGGASREAIVERVRSTWLGRTDRGAEERLEKAARAPLVTPSALRLDPHLEMHTRGG